MSKYSKEGILSGDLDYYCLVCEELLRSDELVDAHVAKPVHMKSLRLTSYVQKHAEDCIRKVKTGYYCECCNILLSNLIKVDLHIQDDKHILNKEDVGAEITTKRFKRVGNAIIALDDLLLDQDAWNTFIDHCCGICGEDLDDGNVHKNNASHALKLIQAKAQLDLDGNLFRKFEETSSRTFQCLTCNSIMPEKSFTKHFTDIEHKKSRLECRKAKRALDKSLNGDNNEVTDKSKGATDKFDVKLANDDVNGQPKLAKSDDKRIFGENNSNNTNTLTAPKTETKNEGTEKPKGARTKDVKYNGATKARNEGAEKPKGATTKDVKHNGETKAETEGERKKTTASKNKITKVREDYDINKRLGIKNYIFFQENSDHITCLLCEWTLQQSTISAHVNSIHHRTLEKLQNEWIDWKLNEENKENVDIEQPADCPKKFDTNEKKEEPKFKVTETKTKTVKAENGDNDANRTDIIEHVDQFKKQKIEVDFICEKVYCKKCKTSLDFDFKTIKNHAEDHNKPVEDKKPTVTPFFANGVNTSASGNQNTLFTSQVFIKKEKPEAESVNTNDVDESKSDNAQACSAESSENDEIKTFANANEITYNATHNTSFCRICKLKIPNCMKNIQEHVKGARHRSAVGQKTYYETKEKELATYTSKKPYTTTDFESFVDTVSTVQSFAGRHLVINEKYYISWESFNTMKKTGVNRWKCIVCDEVCNLNEHKDKWLHNYSLQRLPVVIIKEEFIREIRFDSYHCGFCNELETGWASLQTHLKSQSHKNAKTSADWELQEILPRLESDKEDSFDSVRLALFMHLLRDRFQ